jgi:hypothetical protein
MDTGAAFVATGKTAKAVEPNERALDDPAMAMVIERLVGVELVRPTTRPPARSTTRWRFVPGLPRFS